MDLLSRSKRRATDSAPEDSDLDNEPIQDTENQTVYDETVDRRQAVSTCCTWSMSDDSY